MLSFGGSRDLRGNILKYQEIGAINDFKFNIRDIQAHPTLYGLDERAYGERSGSLWSDGHERQRANQISQGKETSARQQQYTEKTCEPPATSVHASALPDQLVTFK